MTHRLLPTYLIQWQSAFKRLSVQDNYHMAAFILWSQQGVIPLRLVLLLEPSKKTSDRQYRDADEQNSNMGTSTISLICVEI